MERLIANISNEELISITIPEYVYKPNEQHSQVLFREQEFNISKSEADDNMTRLRERACKLIQEISLPDDFIKITHKIWLTNINSPYEPDIKSTNLIKAQYLNLPYYRHIFWTNYPSFCQNFINSWNLDIKIIVEVRDIEEFKDYYGYRVFKSYINQNLFPTACDIVKLQVVCKYGGIYSDIGFCLKNTIALIVKNFNIVINGEFIEPGIVSHNILGSKIREHFLYLTILKIIDDVDKNKKYYNIIKNVWGLVELSSPIMLTVAVSSICKDEKVLLIVNNEYTCDRYQNNSWFGVPRYGCKLFENIDYEQFERDLNIL